MAIKLLTDEERLLSKRAIDRNGCWLFTGNISKQGYGQFHIGSRTDNTNRNIGAHRISYQLLVGEIPVGYEVDHTCHSQDLTCKAGVECLHRRCFNPAHLEAVTQHENILRSIPHRDIEKYSETHKSRTGLCKHGHALDYSYVKRNGRVAMGCRTCRNKLSWDYQKRTKGWGRVA